MAQTTPDKTKGFFGRILQLKRPLVPIEQYAAREGISVKTIEKFAKSGLLQIRKFKGKSFVVDLPVKPNVADTDTTGPQEDIFESLSIIPPQQVKISQKPPDLQAASPRRSSAERPSKTTPPAGKKPQPTLRLDQPVIKVPEIKHLQFEMVSAQARLKRKWQIVAAVAIGTLIGLSSVCVWLYIGHQFQKEKIKQSEFIIETAYSNTRKARQYTKSLEDKLQYSNEKITSLQKELELTRARAHSLRNELIEAKENMEAGSRRNIDSLNRLNARIRELTKKINQMAEPAKELSGSNPAGK